MAMMGGHTESFLHLLNALPNFPIQSADNQGRNLFHYAGCGNAIACIEFLAELGCKINKKDNMDRNIIHFAARFGHLTFIKNIKNNCSENEFNDLVKQADQNGLTPLHYAAIEGTDSLCKFLLDHSGSITARDNKNRTPIHYAIYYNNSDFFSKLIYHRDIINDFDDDGLKLIHLATFGSSIHSFEFILSLNSTSITFKDTHGKSVLFYATSIDFLQNLLSRNLDLYEKDDKGQNILYESIIRERFEIIKWLIEDKNFSINVTDNNGIHPLHYACKIGNLQILKYLLSQNSIEIDCKDNEDRTILHYACSNNNLLCIKEIYDNHISSKMENVKKFLDQKDKKGRSCLDYASFFGYTDIVKYLYSIHHFYSTAKDGRTPLLAAVYSMKSSCDSSLLDCLITRFDINAQDNCNRTALHRAAFNTNLSCIKYLIEHSADIELLDNQGRSACMIAASKGSKECVSLLINSSSSPENMKTQKDKKNRTIKTHWRIYHKKQKISKIPKLFDKQSNKTQSEDLSDELDDWVTFDGEKSETSNSNENSTNHDENSKIKLEKQQIELNNLKNRIKLLNEVISETQGQLENADEVLNEVKKSNERKLQDKDNAISNWKAQCDEKSLENTKLTQIIDDQADTINKLKNTINENETQKKMSAKQLADTKDECNIATQNWHNAEVMIREQQLKIEVLTNRLGPAEDLFKQLINCLFLLEKKGIADTALGNHITFNDYLEEGTKRDLSFSNESLEGWIKLIREKLNPELNSQKKR